MPGSKTLPVSPVLVDKVFSEKGLSLTYASQMLGKSDSYLSTVKYNGAISKTSTILIEKIWGIPYEDYAPIPEPEPQDDPLPWDIEHFEEKLLSAPSTVILSSESITELCNAMHGIIYDAVYNAVDKAMREVLL